MPQPERPSLGGRLVKHTVSLALTVALLIVLDADAKAMIYGVYLYLCLKYAVIWAFPRIHRGARQHWQVRLVERLTSPPLPEASSEDGPRTIRDNVLLVSMLALTSILMISWLFEENQSVPVHLAALTSGAWLAGWFLMERWYDRSIVLDFEAGDDVNCGYNFDETAGILLAVFVGSGFCIPATMFGARVADWMMMAIVLAGLELSELWRPHPNVART